MLSSCIYYMEDFYYRSILFDNGDNVHWYMMQKNSKWEFPIQSTCNLLPLLLLRACGAKSTFARQLVLKRRIPATVVIYPLGSWLMSNTFAKKRKQIGVEEHLTWSDMWCLQWQISYNGRRSTSHIRYKKRELKLDTILEPSDLREDDYWL